jgi:hypothetical protein
LLQTRRLRIARWLRTARQAEKAPQRAGAWMELRSSGQPDNIKSVNTSSNEFERNALAAFSQ